MRADLLQQLHLLPRAVRDVIGDATAQGCSKPTSGHATHAWVLHRQSLLVWKAEDGAAAAVRRLTLPWTAAMGGTFVEVVPQHQSSALTVIVCTAAGWLHVWLDATFGGEPFSQQVVKGADGDAPNLICALAATAAGAGASPAFLAVVATADAALHLYHGSQNGIFPRLFYNPRSAAASQGGMLQAITAAVGTAKKVAVDLNLLEGIPHLRTSASTAAASQLQLLQLDSSRWKLFVLTKSAPGEAPSDAIDCWLLGTLSGKQSSEQLLWSLDVTQAVQGRSRVSDQKILAFTASTAPAQQQLTAPASQDSSSAPTRPSTEVIYVWSSSMLADTATTYQHTCSAFAVEGGPRQGPRLILSTVIPTAAAMPLPKLNHRWQLLAHGQQPSCLLLAPNGVLVEWLRTVEGLPKVLSSNDSNVAMARSGHNSNWQVLNKVFGVLEFSAQGCEAAPQHPIDAAKALLERVVGMMEQAYAEGCPYRELGTGLAECLSGLGMLDSPEGRALLVAASSSIVDSLPKAGTLGFDSLKGTLAEKQARHSLLLTALQVGGVLRQMPPSVLAALFEHAQMLQAAARVLDYQRGCEGAASDRDAASQVDRLQPQASQRAIEAAGSLAAAGAGDVAAAAEQLHKIFFGRPTISMPALFQAVAAQAAQIRRSSTGAGEASGGAGVLLHQLLGLCGLLVAAADAAGEMQRALRQSAHNEVSKAQAAGPGWLAGQGPRAAWSELSEACLLVLPLLTELSQQQQLAHLAHLPALSHLLGALQATLNDAADPSADMVVSYRELPWRHGQLLLQVASGELPVLRSRGLLELSSDSLPGVEGDTLALLPGLREALVWRLQALAEQHKSWELLYATCEVMQGISTVLEDQLQQKMRSECAASGPVLSQDSFTFFVMQRWHYERRVVDLLQLGREGFDPQLQVYLTDCPQLLWMSQAQAKQYAAATSSLSKAADAGTAAEATRLWALVKLSAKASGARGGSGSGSGRQLMATASARLRQLQLQAELLPSRQQPMVAEELASVALRAAGQAAPPGGSDQAAVGLRGADAAVAAVEVLALDAASSSTSTSYREVWELCWSAVLQATPLQQLAQERTNVAEAGWQPDSYEALVRSCPLYTALLAAGGALRDAAAVSPDVEVRDRLHQVASTLQAQVPDGKQKEAYSDVVKAAAAAIGLA